MKNSTYEYRLKKLKAKLRQADRMLTDTYKQVPIIQEMVDLGEGIFRDAREELVRLQAKYYRSLLRAHKIPFYV